MTTSTTGPVAMAKTMESPRRGSYLADLAVRDVWLAHGWVSLLWAVVLVGLVAFWATVALVLARLT